MPLILLGLIVLIFLLIFAIINYISDGKDNEAPVRRRKKGSDTDASENKTLYFPTENIDTEKHKRNIH